MMPNRIRSETLLESRECWRMLSDSLAHATAQPRRVSARPMGYPETFDNAHIGACVQASGSGNRVKTHSARSVVIAHDEGDSVKTDNRRF